jgi:hypothetical protein
MDALARKKQEVMLNARLIARSSPDGRGPPKPESLFGYRARMTMLRKEEVSLRLIVNAMLYLLRAGCQ